jgi:hypothetical protein
MRCLAHVPNPPYSYLVFELNSPIKYKKSTVIPTMIFYDLVMIYLWPNYDLSIIYFILYGLFFGLANVKIKLIKYRKASKI